MKFYATFQILMFKRVFWIASTISQISNYSDQIYCQAKRTVNRIEKTVNWKNRMETFRSLMLPAYIILFTIGNLRLTGMFANSLTVLPVLHCQHDKLALK